MPVTDLCVPEYHSIRFCNHFNEVDAITASTLTRRKLTHFSRSHSSAVAEPGLKPSVTTKTMLFTTCAVETVARNQCTVPTQKLPLLTDRLKCGPKATEASSVPHCALSHYHPAFRGSQQPHPLLCTRHDAVQLLTLSSPLLHQKSFFPSLLAELHWPLMWLLRT